jgi:DNA polymerase
VSDDVHGRGDAIDLIAAEALRHLRWLAASGVTDLPEPVVPQTPTTAGASAPARLESRPSGAEPSGPASVRSTPKGTSAEAVDASPAVAAPPAAAPPGLSAIRADLGDCRLCKLGETRTHVVFGVGNPSAELMFVGEGPGADEDLQGEPFVGKAGQLLTKMIEAMGYRREDVYIANVVKCRPPGNRNPEPDEIEACEPFLRAQIAAVRPRVIVALGKFAAQTLLRETTPITKLRGRWREYGGVRLMPTFHPAYLLRSPEEKKKAWEDLQLVMKELGKEVPKR